MGKYSGFPIRCPFWISLTSSQQFPIPEKNERNNFLVIQVYFREQFLTLIRNFAEGKDFPQDSDVWPNIRLAIKNIIRQGFDGHPLDWPWLLFLLHRKSIRNYGIIFCYRLDYISLFLVTITLHLSRHSEIGPFDDSVIG